MAFRREKLIEMLVMEETPARARDPRPYTKMRAHIEYLPETE